MQEGASTPGRSLLSDMRAQGGDAAGLDFEDLEDVAAVLHEAETWAPTAVALDNLRLRGSASFDIITTLVDIYGDALFVSEYKCAAVAAARARGRRVGAAAACSAMCLYCACAASRSAHRCGAEDALQL